MSNKVYSITGLLYSSLEKGSWTFIALPETLDFEATNAFGRTPIIAEIEGKSWSTSLWRESSGESYIAVPKKIRGSKGNGEQITISFYVDTKRMG